MLQQFQAEVQVQYKRALEAPYGGVPWHCRGDRVTATKTAHYSTPRKQLWTLEWLIAVSRKSRCRGQPLPKSQCTLKQAKTKFPLGRSFWELFPAELPDWDWLKLAKNQVKVVGEREILASLVEFKHHSMAETIRKEKGEKKIKPRHKVWQKKIKSIKLQNSISP